MSSTKSNGRVSSSTISSPSTLPKKRALVIPPSPISTTSVIQSSNSPPTTSPIVSKKPTKIPLRKPNSTNTPLTTPLVKKRIIPKTTTPAPPAPRSVSRASNHTATSSRASTPNSSSTTLLATKKKVVPAISRRPSVTTTDLTIEDLKDKNNKMQIMLSQKEDLLEEKEIELKELNTKLEQLEYEIENQRLLMQQQESSKSNLKTAEMEKESFVAQQQELEDRQQALLEKIQLLQNKSNELKQSFDHERDILIQQYGAAEEKNRENIKKIREKLENEKAVLNSKLLDKERDIKNLKKDMDDMRDNIREMHQSHQTRLTTLTNQLSQQHTKHIDQLKTDYENRFNSRDTNNDGDRQRFKELELMESKFNDYTQLSQKKEAEKSNGVLSKEKFDTLEKNHHNEIEKLKDNSAEMEFFQAVYKVELNQYKTKLQAAKEEIQLIEEERRKEKSEQTDIALIQEEYQALSKEWKETHVNETKDIICRLEKDHAIQLKLEVERAMNEVGKLTSEHQKELKSQQTHILELTNNMKSHQLQVSELKHKLNTMSEEAASVKMELEKKNQEMKTEISKKDQTNNDTITALRFDVENNGIDNEKKKYSELLMKYDALNTALVGESKMSQKDAELKSTVVQLETEHNLIIKNHESNHQSIIDDLKSSHKKELELVEWQGKSDMQSKGEKAESSLAHIYETEIQQLKSNEQQLKEKSLRTIEQVKINHLELENKDQKYHLLEDEYNQKLDSQRLLYLDGIDKLERDIFRFKSELKGKSIKNEAAYYKDPTHLHSEMSNLKDKLNVAREVIYSQNEQLKEVKDQLKAKVNDVTATQEKLHLIIEQHQKELDILQNQFQNLLDIKDKELNDLSYKIKSKIDQELRNQLLILEDSEQNEISSFIYLNYT